MINLKEYGYNEKQFMDSHYESNTIPARVLAVHRDSYDIITMHGESKAKLKSGVYYKNESAELFPATGDYVMVDYNQMGDSLIVQTLDRRSYFSRKSPDRSKGEQAIASNFDYAFILTSLNHDFNVNRIERYLALAWQSGAIPVVLLTKADLVDDYTNQLAEASKVAIGVDVIAISAVNGEGMEQLNQYLNKGTTIVFLGSSGVGKSSLVNSLAGKEIMKVNLIREDDSMGRHTTTHRQLLKLDNGVMIIDTPGMREIGMWDNEEGINELYVDVETLINQCKFRDCSHGSEVGCAIKSALADGTLSTKRWNNYKNLKKEAIYSLDRKSYLRGKNEFHKQLRNYMTKSKWYIKDRSIN